MRIDIEGKTVGYLSRPFARRVRETVAEDGIRGCHHPCMASTEVDPELSDTRMHLSGYIFRAAINTGLRRK